MDRERQPLDDRGLADARLADEDRVVLAPAQQHVNRAFQLVLASDQRVDQSLGGLFVEIDRVALQRLGGRLSAAGTAIFAFLLVAVAFLGGGLGVVVGADFRNSVRDEVDHVEAGHFLLLQEVNGVGVGLGEHRDQHVAAVDFLTVLPTARAPPRAAAPAARPSA